MPYKVDKLDERTLSWTGQYWLRHSPSHSYTDWLDWVMTSVRGFVRHESILYSEWTRSDWSDLELLGGQLWSDACMACHRGKRYTYISRLETQWCWLIETEGDVFIILTLSERQIPQVSCLNSLAVCILCPAAWSGVWCRGPWNWKGPTLHSAKLLLRTCYRKLLWGIWSNVSRPWKIRSLLP